jgi:C4-dicarboxylate-specific signal transduction histidine kinase
MTPSLQSDTAPQTVLRPEVIAQLRGVSVLASLSEERMHCLDGASQVHLDAEQLLVAQGETFRKFCIVLSGSLRASVTLPSGHEQVVHVMESGTTVGEVPLLANMPWTATMRAIQPTEVLELDEDQFWSLMTQCPEVRKAILGDMAARLERIQSNTFQQEKMAALGTLAAGLMHELNNPGSAARRASSQLRENLMRLHTLAARFTRTTLSQEQKECILDLQEHALRAKPSIALSSIEQADAEEALAAWMEQAHVEDAWKLAPTLVAIGIEAETLECARTSFDHQVFSDALNWLEALASSMNLVGTIEESISRVTDLVSAVKTYAYESKGAKQALDVNKSIHATLVILAHKMREKQIKLEKQFAPDLPPLSGGCPGLNQIWTNLLDNAIDAVPESGLIRLRTWAETLEGAAPGEKSRTDVCVLVEDNGSGIPTECQSQIFDPFFTTKPVGVGTGLGLGIVYRIVEQCGGSIRFSSQPGSTEFVVRLPAS